MGAAIFLGAAFFSGLAAKERPLPWGDQGNGTYRNPVLPADYSDPDVIRVGDDFYLVASDFHFVGIQVLHSRDLVNWRLIGQVFSRLTMAPKYDEMKGYAEGTWAPTLRYHAGKYFLYVCTPHDGLFLWTAQNPAGPWSEMVTVKQVDKWEDPCPFWDDDGQAYLVHSVHGAGPLILHRLSSDGARLLDEGVEIYRGPVAEGPKLFKRAGWYTISLPEGGVEKGGQTILRSRQLYGPYERREVLPGGSPHQGALVDLDSGETWFLGYKSTGHLGRVTHLMPVRWGADGWPQFGENGQTVMQAPKPNVKAAEEIARPQTSDGFDEARLSPQWQWNHNPVDGRWSLTARPGWLRLWPQAAGNLTEARSSLTQKIWGHQGRATAILEGTHLGEGQRAGLAFMSGKVFSSLGIIRKGGRLWWEWAGQAKELEAPERVWIRLEYLGDQGRLFFSRDGLEFLDTGATAALKFSQWKGARLALYSYGAGEGWVDVEDFAFEHGRE